MNSFNTTLTIVKKKQKKGWMFIALEFDLLEFGRTEDITRRRMKKIVDFQIEAIMECKGPVEKHCPSGREEWNYKVDSHYFIEATYENGKYKAKWKRLD